MLENIASQVKISLKPEATKAFLAAGKVKVQVGQAPPKSKDVACAKFLTASDFKDSKQGRNNMMLFLEAMRQDFGRLYYPLVVDGSVRFKDPKSKKNVVVVWAEFLARIPGYMLVKYGKGKTPTGMSSFGCQ